MHHYENPFGRIRVTLHVINTGEHQRAERRVTVATIPCEYNAREEALTTWKEANHRLAAIGHCSAEFIMHERMTTL